MSESPVDDLEAVARRIDEHLNRLYFHETSKAFSVGVCKPGAYVEDGLVVLVYSPVEDAVYYMLKERAARAYDRWLAAGNVGRHYDGQAMREDVAQEMR